VREHVEDAGDAHPQHLGARRLHRVDLEADLVQRGDDVVDGRVDRREVADPRQRRAHD
jgi:hypothetical protein